MDITLLDINGNGIPGCQCLKTQTFVVNPIPGFPDVTANPQSICSGETTTLTANSIGANSYTWLPTLNNNNPYITNIQGGNTTFTVIAGNGTGCTSSNTITIFDLNCCKNPSPNAYNFKNVIIMPFGTSNAIPWISVITNTNYANVSIAAPANGILTGGFTFDGYLIINAPNLTIQAANCYITEGTYIRNNQNLTISRSYLHGCSKMWRGILSYNYLSISSSIIEDAQNAVFPFVLNHGGLDIRNNIFNVNFNALNIQNVNFATNFGSPIFAFTGNIITSKILPSAIYNNFSASTNTYVISVAPNLNTYSISNLKGSTILNIPSNITANNGINLGNIVNSSNLSIGSDANTVFAASLLTNYFDLVKRGIQTINTRLVIYNNVFQNIIGSGPAFAGVYHNGGQTTIGNGASVPTRTCKFINCNYGVYATGSGTLLSSYNTYSFNSTANRIEFFSGIGALASINNNTLSNCTFELNSFSNGNAARINFNFNTATFNNFSNQKRYHVFINELSTVSSPTYVVWSNNITGKDVGVYMANVNKSSVLNNTITTSLFNTIIGGNNGIQLSNTSSVTVSDNIITCSTSNVNLNTNVIGVYSGNTSNNIIACNTIYNMGACLKFQGPNPCGIWFNSFNLSGTAVKYGIWIDNSATTGPIGYTINPTTFGYGGNIFGLFDYSNNGSDTYASNSSIGSKIYFQGPGIGPFSFFNPFNPKVNGAEVIPVSFSYSKAQNTNIPNGYACGQPPQNAISPGIPPFFGNSLNFGTNTNNALLIARKSIFSFIRTNNVNPNVISGAGAFIANASVGNIGAMFKVDSLAATQSTNNYVNAGTVNSNMNASGVVEQTQKDFNALYIDFKLNQTLNSTQLIQLIGIAQQCPFTDGSAVYQARALLTYFDSTIYVSSCEQTIQVSARGTSIESTINKNDAVLLRTVVYPNPAKEELFIETEVQNTDIVVYSITGQELINTTLKDSKTKLDISSLPNGTYIYKIKGENGELIKTDKLIILK